MAEPQFDAIQFLDGWTGRAWWLGAVYLCGPRTDVEHGRHATEAEAIECIKGEWQPGRSPFSVAEANRIQARRAETPPVAPQGGSGTSGRPTVPAASTARGRRPASALRRAAPTVPPRLGHPAGCKHKWCYCHDAEHAREARLASQSPGVQVPVCRMCRTEEFNRRSSP